MQPCCGKLNQEDPIRFAREGRWLVTDNKPVITDAVRHDAEAFILGSTAEELTELLAHTAGWRTDPRLEPLRNLDALDVLGVNSMFLEGIWVKTGNPGRVFEVLLQPDEGEDVFGLDCQYCEMFNLMPWLGRMWAKLPARVQVGLTLFVLGHAGSEDSNPNFTKDEAFDLATSLLHRMRNKHPPTTTIGAHLVILDEACLTLKDNALKYPTEPSYQYDPHAVLALGVQTLSILVAIEEAEQQ